MTARVADRLLVVGWDAADWILIDRLFAQGKIKPVIYRTFPLERAAEAHALMESSTHVGKIVLQVV
jgi:NADPH:quinone reductase-like Zn-dependent oxidoreductase